MPRRLCARGSLEAGRGGGGEEKIGGELGAGVLDASSISLIGKLPRLQDGAGFVPVCGAF